MVDQSQETVKAVAVIRKTTPADVLTITELVKELAEYEKEPDAAVATQQRMHDALFGPNAVAYALLAEVNGEAVGFAVYFFNFSTWLGLPGLYLEDLFVRPAARGLGIGRQLLQHLARIAVERGCGRMEWAVLDWNTPAIEFYKKLGATPMDGWTIHRVTGDSLTALASK